MNIGLIVLLTIVPHLAFAGARVNLSLYSLNLGATPFTVGIIISLLAVVPMVYSSRWGRRIDRIGVYQPMLLGAALMLAGLTLGVALPYVQTLFVVSVLAGSGFMLYHICVNQAAAQAGGAQSRTRNFTLLALAFSTSGFMGPMLAGFSIDGFGYRNTFLLCALLMVVTLILIRRLRRPLSRLHKPHAGTQERQARDLLRIPALLRVFIISGLLSMCWDLYTFVMPIHGSAIGLSASTIGLILGSFGCAIFLFRLTLPWIVHRIDERTMIIVAMTVTGLMLALIPLVHSVPLLMLVSFVLGIGLGGTQPMIMTMLYEKAPAGRGGEAVGMRTQLLNITQAGIPLIFGALGSILGMTPVFFAMAAAILWGAWYAKRG
ncbi:MAG: MFS transporter [Betaproteobacteria bacterium]|nr:MFS transporter [Betaproteobacteria bacterium]